MSQECGSLTSVEAAFYGGIPSLMFSVKSLDEMRPKYRFDEQKIDIPNSEYDSVITHFVNEVFTGTKETTAKTFRRFDMFASIMPDEQQTTIIVWPLCYISCIIGKFGQRHRIFKSLHDLVEGKLQSFMQMTETGLDWEILVQLAIVMRMIQARAKGSTGAFGLIPAFSCPVVSMMSLNTLTLEEALEEIQAERLKYHNLDFVIVATPTYSKFPDFDGFIIQKDRITGYQVKLGRACPKREKLDWMEAAFLIRGRAPSSTNLMNGWTFASEESVKSLLGCSLRCMYPNSWLDIPLTDSFD